MRMPSITLAILLALTSGCAALGPALQGVAKCGVPLLTLGTAPSPIDWGRAAGCWAVEFAGGLANTLESAPVSEPTPEMVQHGRLIGEAARLQSEADADPGDHAAQRAANSAALRCQRLAP